MTSFLLTVPAFLHAGNSVIVESAAADPGQSDVTVNISITNDVVVHAVSLSLRYDSANLSLQGVEPGPATATAPFFNYKSNIAESSITVGSVLSFVDSKNVFQSGELTPTDNTAPHVVAVLRFKVSPTAPTGLAAISPTQGLGTPPVSNEFSIAGEPVFPSIFTPGGVVVKSLYRLRLQNVNVVPGKPFRAAAEIQTPSPISGGAFAYTFDNSAFSFNNASFLNTEAHQDLGEQLQDPNATTIEFFQVENESDFAPGLDRATVGFVNDFSPPFEDQTISSTVGDEWKSIVHFTMSSLNSDPAIVGTTQPLTLNNANAAQSVDNHFLVGQTSILPDLFHGLVTFVETIPFTRGLTNSDGHVDISDVIWFLTWQFFGTVKLECEDAADANADGRKDISDAIFLLSFILLGTEQPPPPYPDCGAGREGEFCPEPLCLENPNN